MTLRESVVEAMAQALRTFYQLDEIPTDIETSGWGAEAALDSALETLDELRDDWNKAAMRRGSYPPYMIPDAKYLLAVLRAGKGSDE